MKRPQKARFTSWQLLREARDWLDRALDDEEGVNYMNGDSKKYKGDGWVHAEQLQQRLAQYLSRDRRTLR